MPRFCWGFLGLALVRLWIQYYIHSFYFIVDIGELSITSKLFRGTLILVCVAILARTGLSPKAEAAWRWLSLILMTLSGIFFFLQMQLSSPDVVLGTLGAFVGAMGVIWGGGMWMQLFVRMRAGEAFLYIVGCLGLGSLLGFLFGFLPAVVAAVILLFVPVLIFVAEGQARRTLNARGNDGVQAALCDTIYDREPRSTFIYLLAGMSLFVLTMGVAQGFPSGGKISFSHGLQAIHQLSVVALTVGLIVWVLIWGRGLNFRALWSFEALLAIGSLACYLAVDVVPATYGATLAVIPITLWLGIAFLVACDLSCHTSTPAYLVLGILYGTYTIMFNLGRLASLFFGAMFEQNVVVLSAMVFSLAMSMALILLNPLPKKRPFFAGLASTRQQGADISALNGKAPLGLASETVTALYELANQQGLTERELQIALFLAKGRSRRYISETLFLSENTVRNHMRNIYQKLGVHTKQEFIDLVESHS